MCFHVDSSLADKIGLLLSAACTSQRLIAQRKMFPSLTFHHISLPVTGGHTGEKVAQGYRHPPRAFYRLPESPSSCGRKRLRAGSVYHQMFWYSVQGHEHDRSSHV